MSICVFLVSCAYKANAEETEVAGAWDSGLHRVLIMADSNPEMSIGEKYGYNYHYEKICTYRYRNTKVTNEDTIYVFDYTISKQWDSEQSEYKASKDTRTYTFEYNLTTKKLTVDSRKYTRT